MSLILNRGFSKFVSKVLQTATEAEKATFKAVVGSKTLESTNTTFDDENGFIRLEFHTEETVKETTKMTVKATVKYSVKKEKIDGEEEQEETEVKEAEFEIANGTWGTSVEANSILTVILQIANCENTDPAILEHIVDANFPLLIESSEYLLLGQIDCSMFDYITVTAEKITLKVWDYDNHETVFYEPNFSTSKTVNLEITESMRGMIEFQAKGAGQITALYLGKGQILGEKYVKESV